MFSISMTIGPRGRIVSVVSIFPGRRRCERRTRLFRCGRFLVEDDFRSVLQFAADRTVAARDDFVPWLDAALDLHVGVVGDSGRDLHPVRLAILAHRENALVDFLAPFFLGFLLE